MILTGLHRVDDRVDDRVADGAAALEATVAARSTATGRPSRPGSRDTTVASIHPTHGAGSPIELVEE